MIVSMNMQIFPGILFSHVRNQSGIDAVDIYHHIRTKPETLASGFVDVFEHVSGITYSVHTD
jgi:hypothetical protein